MKERILWVDIFKGLVIFFVVAGHANSPLSGFFYLFHVGAFFFISGFTTGFEKQKFLDFSLKRIRSLLIPYFFTNAGFLILLAGISFAGIGGLFSRDPLPPARLPMAILQLVASAQTPEIGGATWFLLVLLAASILSWGLLFLSGLARQFGERAESILVLLVMGLALYGGTVLVERGLTSRFLLDLTPYAAFFMLAGYLCRRHGVFDGAIDPAWAVPISLFFSVFLVWFRWSGVNWPPRSFESFPFPNLFGAAAGIYLSFFVSERAARVPALARILSVAGRQSLAILGFHFIFLQLSYLGLWLLGVVPKEQVQRLSLPDRVFLAFPLAAAATVASAGVGVLLERWPFTRWAFLGRPFRSGS